MSFICAGQDRGVVWLDRLSHDLATPDAAITVEFVRNVEPVPPELRQHSLTTELTDAAPIVPEGRFQAGPQVASVLWGRFCHGLAARDLALIGVDRGGLLPTAAKQHLGRGERVSASGGVARPARGNHFADVRNPAAAARTSTARAHDERGRAAIRRAQGRSQA
jgi:hypothetical protein